MAICRPKPLGLLLLLAACSDRSPFGVPDNREPASFPTSPGVLVSDPFTPPAGSPVYPSLVDPLVWVSLVPETAPDGFRADIRSSGGGIGAAPLVSGGFDPVPVTATRGDTITITVYDDLDRVLTELRARVRPDKPPVVVRTDPPPRKRDVPLNARILVVFTEPVSPGSVTGATVRLEQAGVPVAGAVQVLPGALMAEFVPAVPLVSNTDYALQITTGVTDLNGTPLEDPIVVSFTTGTGMIGFLRVITATSGQGPDPDGYRVIIDADTNGAPGVEVQDTVVRGLLAGVHTVSLTGIAANCTEATGVNRTTTVPASDTISELFGIVCTNAAGAGSIQVDVTTTGVSLDPDGYVIQLDGGAVFPVGVNGSVLVSGVAPGVRSLALLNTAGNCAVVESNPQGLLIQAGPPATLRFQVICAAAGSISLQVNVSGANPYYPCCITADVLGGESWTVPLGTGGTHVFSGLPPGTHTVALQNVGSHAECMEPAPVTADVAVDDTAHVAITLQCTLNGGAIEIIARTLGADLDPDGYVIELNGQPLATVAAGYFEFHPFPGLTEGYYTVQLTGVASNCQVRGTNLRSIWAPKDSWIQVMYDLDCRGGATLTVTSKTTGSQPDPDGYRVQVEGVFGDDTLGVNDTLVFHPPVGNSYVHFLGLSDNCAPVIGTSLPISLAPGDSVGLEFEVQCGLPGMVTVTVAQTGSDPDGDGFWVTDGFSDPKWFTGSTTFSVPLSVPVDLRLGGIALNCEITSPGPWIPIQVSRGQTVQVDVAVDCLPATQLALERYGTLYVLNSNGTNMKLLGPGGEPAWSPDGRIAYSNRVYFCCAFTQTSGQHDIWVMNADGSGKTLLTNHPADDISPAWSPDGSQIAFVSNRAGQYDVYVMNADGSNPVRVTSTQEKEDQLQWSPDGSRFALVIGHSGGGSTTIHTMNTDGTGLSLPYASGRDPAWSPDGLQLAFWTQAGVGFLYIINADGTGLRAIPGFSAHPSWSPDGRWIAAGTPDGSVIQPFLELPGGVFGVMADGSGLTRPINVVWGMPVWRPAP